MDFQLTDEQALLRDTTRDLLSRTYDPESRNKVIGSDLGWSREVWSQLADTGILGLGFDAGLGLDSEEAGQIEIMVVLTEIGRRLAPEPVVHAALGPGSLIAELGSDEQKQLLGEVAAGQRLLAFAHLEAGHRRPTTEVATRAEPQGDSWSISGRKNPVLAGDCADTLIVSAALPQGGTGLFLVAADAVRCHAYPTFDGQRGAQIDLDNAPAEPLGDAADVSAAIGNNIIRVQSALCSEAIGAMEEALRLTTDYLKTRKQFGVTLNKFQALTQRAADMYVSLELARSMSLYAAMSIADGNLDPVIASRAKLQIGRSARHIWQEAIQMHGGIGITAEYPVAHYAARLTAIENTLGTSGDHLHNLIDHIADHDLARL